MPFSNRDVQAVQHRLPYLTILNNGIKAYLIKAITESLSWYQGWKHYFYPSGNEPNASKTYKTRPHLPISIFTPAGNSASSLVESLPTLFTIHGGGFTVGNPADNEKWNRVFADTHQTLIIALNYSKAPHYPFPTAIHDIEALVLAILADDTIPIDRTRCAIAGFSAGASLALAACQSKAIKTSFKDHGSLGFRAVIPLYPGLDRTVTRDHKVTLRQFKAGLTPNRNSNSDFLLGMGKLFDWSYVSPGHDLRDPLLSPIFAPREILPPKIFMIACELDLSAHDSWRMACKMAGRPEPSMNEKVGREECGKIGELELADENFSWESRDRAVRWLLIPDVVHGFDHFDAFMLGDDTSVRDAERKVAKMMEEIGDWLRTRAWAE